MDAEAHPVFCDDIINVEAQEDVTLICYADDPAVVVIEDSVKEVKKERN